jgi:hypothetical protein
MSGRVSWVVFAASIAKLPELGVILMSAFGGKADISATLSNVRF